MKRYLYLLSALSMKIKKLTLLMTLFLLAATACGCTKAQTTAVVNEVAKIGVDFCKEAPALVPPSAAGVVALACQVYDNSEKTLQVLVDKAVWNSMKANYLAQHGSLPRGMTAPTPR